MNLALDFVVDQLPPAEPDKQVATWYTQGHSDGLGDRLLMFDNTSAPSWEILRFKPSLARTPAFERALRDRLAALRSFQHPAFPIVRSIDELGRDDGLAVASTYSTGVRLSEALTKPRSVAFAFRLLNELVPAVAALQGHGRGISHGALTLDRITVTADGRLSIREHMVGSALAGLGASVERMWTEFAIPTFGDADSGVPSLDCRNDVFQIALIAMSLIAGRRVSAGEDPGGQLLDQVLEAPVTSTTNLDGVRDWFRRALQTAPDAFASAREASAALAELRDERTSATRPVDVQATLLNEASDLPRPGPRPVASRPLSSVDRLSAIAEQEIAPILDAPKGAAAETESSPRGRLWLRTMQAVAVGAALVAGVESVVIGRALLERPSIPQPAVPALSIDALEPGTQVWVDGELAGSTPFQLKIDPRVHSVRLRPPDAATVSPSALSPARSEPAPISSPDDLGSRARTASAAPKSGGFQLNSPVDLYVMDGERLLGASSDGPIFGPAGVRDLDFVNTSIGFRIRRTVNIKPGQISTVSVAVPNGTLNINAAPWASVSVDGNSVGDTPIGNLSIAAGPHEIVFRHPQLGERRQRTIVRVDGPTRVTANFQR